MNAFPRWLKVGLALVALGILAGGTWFYRHQEQRMRQSAEEQLQAVAELKIRQIVRWRKERLADANLVRGTLDATRRALDAMAQPESQRTRQMFTGWLDPLLASEPYERALLLDAGLNVRLVHPESASRMLCEAVRGSAEQALRTREVVVADLHREAEDGPVHLSLLVPLLVRREGTNDNVPAAGLEPSAADRSAGVLVLEVNAQDYFFPLLQSWPTPSETAETLLIRREGDAALYLNELRHQTNTALKLRLPLSQTSLPAVMAVLGAEGVRYGQDYRGVDVLSALKAVPNSPWFMVAKVDAGEVFAAWRTRSLLILTLLALGLVLVGAALFVVWQRNQKTHYRALYQAEARQGITLQSIGDAVIATDAQGRVELLNPVAEALTGWKQDVARGQPLEEVFRIVNEETRQPVENPVKQVLREGMVVGLANHTVLLAKDGTERPIADSGAPIRDAQNQIIGVVLVFREQTEERAAQKALRASEARLNEAQRLAHLGSWESEVVSLDDFARNRLTWSDETFRLFGYEPGAVAVTHDLFLSCVHPEDRSRVRSMVLEALRERKPYQVEHRVVRPDGSERFVLEQAELICEAATARPLKLIGTVQDITERKRAAEALQTSEALHHSLVENVRQHIFRKDAAGRFTFGNGPFCQGLGKPLDDILGKTDADFFPPALAAKYQRDDQRVLQTGQPFEGEEAFQQADGQTVFMHVVKTPLRDAAGQIIGLQGIAWDVTERKRAEVALHESEDRYRLLVEESPDAIGIYQEDKLVFINSTGAELLGAKAKAELLGRTSEQIIHPEDLPAAMERVRRRLAGERGVYPAAVRYVRLDGTTLPVEVGAAAITFAGKPAVQFIARDITARQQAEAALRASEERFRLLAESSLTGIYLFQDHRFRYVNQALASVFGYTVEELMDRLGPLELTHPDDRPRVLENVRRRVSGEVETVHCEFRGLRKDGTTIQVETHGRRIESEGRIGIIGTLRDITESKRAEAALRESEDRYRLLVEESPDAIGIYQEDKLVFVNATGAQLLGARTPAEILGWSGERLIHAEDLPATRERLRRRLAGETGLYPVEVRYLRLDGTVLPVEVIATPILYGGKPAVQFIARDITARKRVEEALRESESELRQVIDLVPHSIYAKDRESRFIMVNRRSAELMGTTTHDAVGKSQVELTPVPGEAEEMVAEDREVLERQAPIFGRERVFTDAHGVKHVEEITKIPFTTRRTQGMAVLGISVDITERKRVEEQLRRQAALLDAANDAIYVCGLDLTVTYWNAGAERLFGWSRAEAPRRKMTELGEVDPAAFAAAHAALLAQGSWSGELKKTGLAGKEFVVFCRWTLLRDEQGRPTEVLAINTDITERRQLEASFLRAQRLEGIGALAGGIAHDLNNILAPILMSTSLLRETVSDPESRQMIDTMETCAQRGADIIKQLLTFARGKPGARVALPVRHLLNEMDKIIRETFPRNIQARVHAPTNLWPVLGDATQVHQALLNLCVNARDAMPEGGTLTLAAENIILDEAFAAMAPDTKPGIYVCLSVTDTGSGIPPGQLDLIFDPFFTTKEIGKGTGLGLATVLGIVRGHGGFVRVNSRVGRGTTFELYLPASPEAKATGPSDTEAPPPRGRGELILVVDDEAAVRGAVQRTLETHGYRVLVAGEGAEAMALFTRPRAEVRAVLTDMMMPGMDGPALVRALRLVDARLPILGMTGLAERAGVKGMEGLDLPVVLTKPFLGAKLLAAVHEALATTRSAPDEKA